MDIYKASKRLSETHTAKYKPSHSQFLLHKKFSTAKQKAGKASTEFQVKNLYFCCIKCYTCIALTRNTVPCFYQSFKSREVFSIFNMWWYSIHIFGFRTLKILINKFRFYWLRAGVSNALTSKMFDIKYGFNWCRVLKIWTDGVFSIFLLSLLICLNFLNDQRSFLYSHFGGTGGLFFTSFQPFVMTFGY